MSHVIVASIGSHGDVFPYVALGRALRARGHRVTLAANESYRALALAEQLAFAPLVSHAETEALFAQPDLWHPLKSGLVGARWGRRLIRSQYELLRDLARDDDAVLAASAGVFAARLVQERHARPLATVFHMPWMIPSSTAPPAMTGGVSLPRWAPRPVGRLYWRVMDAVGAKLVGVELNPLRVELGLEPVRRIFRWHISPELSIGLFPAWYAEPQPDWPTNLKVASFPTFQGPSGPAMDAQALEFCQAGMPPVAFTFGTGMQHAAELLREAVAACAVSDTRGIILTRHADQLPAPLPANVRHFDYVPLRQLLPHCAVIVHHGGIGTVAAALATGTPQLIIPHAWDQLDNARRMIKLGAGAMLSRRRCSARNIAKALTALAAGSVPARCREIAALPRDEEAMDAAAHWIEELAL